MLSRCSIHWLYAVGHIYHVSCKMTVWLVNHFSSQLIILSLKKKIPASTSFACYHVLASSCSQHIFVRNGQFPSLCNFLLDKTLCLLGPCPSVFFTWCLPVLFFICIYTGTYSCEVAPHTKLHSTFETFSVLSRDRCDYTVT
jgi:hypothetical protein